MKKDIHLIINEKEGSIDLLYNGYNLIAKSLYNEDLVNKIIKLIITELKQENNFESLEKLLTLN